MTSDQAKRRCFVDPAFAERHRERYAAILYGETAIADALTANDRDWHASRRWLGWRPSKVFVRKSNRGRKYVGGGWMR